MRNILEYKKLTKAYNKQLIKIHKQNFKSLDKNLDYFVTYLKFIRDELIILNQPDSKDIKAASLVQAISEYESYINCIYKYFKIENEFATPLNNKTFGEASEAYAKEKQHHWDYFWGLVKLNMESWVEDNVTA